MKKRIFKILIPIVLVATFIFGAIGCASGSLSDGTTSQQGYTFLNADQIEFEGVHEFNITETDTDLVKNGKSEYVLVFPDESSIVLTDVKNDFIILFRKATGVTLPIKSASEVVNDWDETKKYISIGDNALVEKAGIQKSEYSASNIKTEGVRIITKGNTQFLLGGNVYGVSNAAYTFLELYFNFDYYHRSAISLDVGVTDIKLKNIDAIDIPDVEHYMGDINRYAYEKNAHTWDAKALGADTYVQEAKVMDNRCRSHTNEVAIWVPIYKDFNTSSLMSYSHTSTIMIPKNSTLVVPRTGEEIVTNSNMFAEGGGDQLCMTAHGDEEDYETMIKLASEKIIYGIMQRSAANYPALSAASITIRDNWDVCYCDACRASINLYGESGKTVMFVNRVGTYVNEWLQTQKGQPWYRDKITIYMYGYQSDLEAPVDAITNADGSITYVPKDSKVVFNEYASVYLVSSHSLMLGGLYDTKQGDFLKHCAGWEAVSNGLNDGIYWYNSPILARDYAYDPFTSYSADFWEALSYYGYTDVMSDHYGTGSELTGWQSLLTYVNSKLRWNCKQDMDTLIKKYMKGMYYEAADLMYDIYTEQLLYYVDIRAHRKEPEQPGYSPTSLDYPYPVLEGWINMFNLAIEEVAHYKETNPDLYETIKTRIQIEMSIEVVKAVSFYGKPENGNMPYSLDKLNEYKAMLNELSEKSPNMRVQGKLLNEYVGA